MTISKAAELLSVTPKTIRVWDAEGKIQVARTPGNQRRIPESEVERLLTASSAGRDLSDFPEEQFDKQSTVFHSNTQASRHDNNRRVFHGTLNPNLKPVYGGGLDYHDYGNGLYCTEDLEAAKEWACQHDGVSTAYVYAFDLNMEGLSPLLDLSKLQPVYWLSALAQYRYGRKESNARRERRHKFIKLFPVDCEQFEVIEGWRADDRYFAYLNSFIGLDISYEAVIQAMKLGDLGQQVVIKGRKAYSQLRQADEKLTVSGKDYTMYNMQYIVREQKANAKLHEVRDIPGIMLDEIIAKGGI